MVNTNDGSSIRTVTCTVFDPNGDEIAQFNMSGSSGSNPSTYSATVNITGIQCLLVGVYRMEYVAENNSGLFSNLIASNFSVVNTANIAPTVSELYAPDSIQVPASGINTGVLSVLVDDSNGICDIKNVFFNSYRPDGTITGGSPFKMFDDGNIPVHGDTVAGDRRYSLIISIPSSQTTFGFYKFIYQAIDNSNLISNQLIDSINVVP